MKRFKNAKYNFAKYYILHLKILYTYKGYRKRLYRKDYLIKIRLNRFYINIKPKFFKKRDYIYRNLLYIFETLIYFLITQYIIIFKKGWPKFFIFLNFLDNMLIVNYYHLKNFFIKKFRKYLITRFITHIYRDYRSDKRALKNLFLLIVTSIDYFIMESAFILYLKSKKIIIYFFIKIIYKTLISYTKLVIVAVVVLWWDYEELLEYVPITAPDYYWLDFDFEEFEKWKASLLYVFKNK